MTFFFVSDLHGKLEKYDRLFAAIREERPEAVLLGGDLLPPAMRRLDHRRVPERDFIVGFLARKLEELRASLGDEYPRILLILGNDDVRAEEKALGPDVSRDLWEYAQGRRIDIGKHPVFGYSYCPPTPFQLKDWEKYDVSRFVDPGCVSPEQGWRTVPISEEEARYSTIQEDLDKMFDGADLSQAILLFHSPPYQTNLDRADLDGKMFDHAPLDVHVGSIAIRRSIEARNPLLTLHGHVHESARLTGSWRDRIGPTHLFSAAHDGPELALVRFDPRHLESATRELIG